MTSTLSSRSLSRVPVRLFLILQSFASIASATPDGPPVAARAEALVALIRSDSGADAVRRFVLENYAASALATRPVDGRVPTLMRVFGDLRGGSVESVRILEAERAELVARGREELWVTFEIEVEAAPPHGILGLRIQADQRPPGGGETEISGPPLTESEALRQIDAEIARRAEMDQFSGVVMVARDGLPLYSKAVGMVDRALGVPNRIDTKFNLGSINKIFTSIVIHQLVAEGKLRLDAPLAEALPGYANREVAAQITVRQLLEHSSGLGDIFNDTYHESPRDRLRSIADYLPLFVLRPLEFAPGSRQQYSNAGYIVLGLVIEKATASSYYEAVAERVFARAGMRDTASWAVDDIVPNRAVGYTQGIERERDPALPLRSNVEALPARGSSAGGGYSTAPDLVRFATALAGGKLLPPAPRVRAPESASPAAATESTPCSRSADPANERSSCSPTSTRPPPRASRDSRAGCCAARGETPSIWRQPRAQCAGAGG